MKMLVVKELEDSDVELPEDIEGQEDLGGFDKLSDQAPAAPLTLVCPSAWHGVRFRRAVAGDRTHYRQ